MSPHQNPVTSLEALLRDACRRALSLGLSFTNQLRLYRSILALAREVRLRSGGTVPDKSDALSAVLATVCAHAAELGLDPDLPLPDALLMQRLAVQLSRAARLAGDTAPAERLFFTQSPMHREEPAQEAQPAQPAGPADHALSAQSPMHREIDASDDRLSAWRTDHKTDRDQRAHEKLRTAIDERPTAKVKAMNQRDREEREAA